MSRHSQRPPRGMADGFPPCLVRQPRAAGLLCGCFHFAVSARAEMVIHACAHEESSISPPSGAVEALRRAHAPLNEDRLNGPSGGQQRTSAARLGTGGLSRRCSRTLPGILNQSRELDRIAGLVRFSSLKYSKSVVFGCGRGSWRHPRRDPRHDPRRDPRHDSSFADGVRIDERFPASGAELFPSHAGKAGCSASSHAHNAI